MDDDMTIVRGSTEIERRNEQDQSDIRRQESPQTLIQMNSESNEVAGRGGRQTQASSGVKIVWGPRTVNTRLSILSTFSPAPGTRAYATGDTCAI